jgi:hypothetical protein
MIKSEVQDKKIEPIVVGKRLFSIGFKEVDYEFEKMNNYCVKIIFKNAKNANLLVNNENFKKHGYKCYIPTSVLIKKGVIHDIPFEITLEEIVKNANCSAKIISAIRLQKRNRSSLNENDRYIDTRSVILKFKAMWLPDNVKIYGVNHRISIFRPRIKVCNNCLQYGHTNFENKCKNVKKCVICGNTDENHNCNQQEYCVNCKGNHKTISSLCQFYKTKERIITESTYGNKTYKEAEKEVLGVLDNNPYNMLSRDEFPELEENSNSVNLNIYKNTHKKSWYTPRQKPKNLNDRSLFEINQPSTSAASEKIIHQSNYNNIHKTSEIEKFKSKIQKARASLVQIVEGQGAGKEQINEIVKILNMLLENSANNDFLEIS